jgi:hypothetical protein
MPHAQFKQRYKFLNIAGNCRVILFEKIYDGEPILPIFSNIGEDLQYRCFNEGYYVKSVSQPNTMPLFGNSYWFQMTETGFAEQF